MNTNIVIQVLHFFQILPKFQEKISHLIIVSSKPYKKKVVPSTIAIIEKEEKLYAKIH